MMIDNTEFKEVKGVGKIPVDWEVKELGEIADYINGKAFKPEDWSNNGIKIIRIQNLNGSNDFNYYKKNIEKKYIVNDMDLLFAWSGSRGTSFGPCIWNNGKSVLNQHIFRVEINEDIDKLFTYYSLKEITPKIEHNAHGSAGLVHVTKEELSKFMIPVPKNRKEQEKIAQILSNVDMNIEKTEEAICKYKQLKKGLMEDLLTGKVRIKDGKRFKETRFKDIKGVGKIPWDWEVNLLEELSIKIGDGLHGTPQYTEDGKYHFVNGNNLENKKIVFNHSTKKVNEIEFLKYKKELTNNSILISLNGTIGSLGFYNYEDIVLGKSAGYITLNKNINREFIYYQLASNRVNEYFIKELTGTTIKNLSLQTLRNCKIVIPPEDEGINIVKILCDSDEIIKMEEKYLVKLKKFKSGLMEDLLTGKVRVNID